ncbi:MAG: hypothetical protein LBT20_02800 [Clostridiales bacterium]|jgi:stage III sporulation protein AG|nr:hypothetical protein [Clostridiales bacterium]
MVNQLVDKKESASETKSESQLVQRFRALTAKVKTVKHIKIIAAAVAVAVVLLGFAAVYQSGKSADAGAQSYATADPLRDLEYRLAAILSEINGAGKVTVMIAYDGSVEYVYAMSKSVTTNKTTDTSGGVERVTENTTETGTPILVNEGGQSKPIVVEEIMPDIKNVMIVAEGANNVTVRMELARATASILGISSNLIEIFTKQK